ncbi:conserved hypothetical protein [uncultured Mycobacterium sp.]|uniref:Uncharacterized protein n=2 Tax=Mycobacteriaceae TaxID=1762 RepID=A0A064CE98_9MYCO|nr:hypothetical protein [Mycolicibacterium aromaticivorans]KDE97077.1 hypothetical protein Y900_027710 [Mycolicibacterium aromaticivorans JS19b1 = JCM 16368]SBS78080.1 conserved hypothetical protein [uncultured Mycobacterium sp.]
MTNPKPTQRRDGHTPRYSYEPDDGTHYIEQSVRVYLRLSDDRTSWIVDAATVDGAALDSAQSDESATNTECACDSAECDAICAAADRLPLPNGEELAQLILDALPPH